MGILNREEKKGTVKKRNMRITFNAPVILGFVAISFGAIILNNITGGASNQLLFMTYHSPLTSPLTYVRFFTHVLGHSGWEHFMGNAMYLLLLGPLLEEKYGSLKVLNIMVITALVTGLINYIFFWNIALCGASSVVFAFILLSSFTSVKEGEIPVTFVLVAVIFLGQQIYDGIFVEDNISNMAHIIGGIVGAIFGFAFAKRKKEV